MTRRQPGCELGLLLHVVMKVAKMSERREDIKTHTNTNKCR